MIAPTISFRVLSGPGSRNRVQVTVGLNLSFEAPIFSLKVSRVYTNTITLSSTLYPLLQLSRKKQHRWAKENAEVDYLVSQSSF